MEDRCSENAFLLVGKLRLFVFSKTILLAEPILVFVPKTIVRVILKPILRIFGGAGDDAAARDAQRIAFAAHPIAAFGLSPFQLSAQFGDVVQSKASGQSGLFDLHVGQAAGLGLLVVPKHLGGGHLRRKRRLRNSGCRQ